MLEDARGLLARRRYLHGVDLLREPARVACRRRVLVGAKRERVDLLARELVAVGDVLGGADHVDVGIARE